MARLRKFGGGWEFAIPSATKPIDGKLTVYAVLPTAFLKGRTYVELKEDFNPATTVVMSRDDSAEAKGLIVNDRGQPNRESSQTPWRANLGGNFEELLNHESSR